jgi:hypothetical protein
MRNTVISVSSLSSRSQDFDLWVQGIAILKAEREKNTKGSNISNNTKNKNSN